MKASAYLHFDGTCEEALGFYAETFGGEIVALMRWADMPGGGAPPGTELKVMHAHLRVGASDILGSDRPAERYVRPAGFGSYLDGIGFRSNELLQYNSGVIFCSRRPDGPTHGVCWKNGMSFVPRPKGTYRRGETSRI